jgi:hypothetical protein
MSRQLLLGLLGALAALLAAAIGYEIFAPNSDESGIAAPAAAHASTPAAAAPGRSAAGAQSAGWVASILARPLFSVTRKPDAGPATAAAAAGDDAATDLPRLSGVFIYSTIRHAVFQPVGDVPPLVVGEGELVAGWTVAKIERGAVTLTGPKGETTVEPKFDENMVPPPPQLPPSLPKPAVAAVRGTVPTPPPPARPNTPPNAGQFQRPVPGQPTAVPTRPPFIPQQRSVPLNGAPVPGAR